MQIPPHTCERRWSRGTRYTSGQREIAVTGTEEAGLRGFRSELWEDDGTSEFGAMFARVEKEGTVRAS